MKASPRYLLAIPAAFAAGWFLRPLPPGGTAAGVQPNAVGATAASLSGSATAKASLPSSAPGAEVLTIKPLTSLKEILDIIGDDLEGSDVSMPLVAMELLPRLMMTDAGMVHAILEDLLNSDNVPSELRSGISIGLMLRWMTLQPDLALGYSLAHPAAIGEMEELNLLGLAWMAKTKPEAAKGLAALLPEDQKDEAQKVLAQLGSLTDPAASLKNPTMLEEMDSDQVASLAMRWMRTDPVAALAWLNGLPAESRHPDMTAAIASVRMQQDPASTLAWIAAMPDGEEKTASREAILGRTLQHLKDEATFEAKLATLPSAWHDAARLKLLSENVPETPAASAAQFQALLARSPRLSGEYYTQNTAQVIAQSFASKNNYTGGADWLLTLPPGGAQETAAKNLMGSWTEQDPTAASSWLSSLPPGSTKEVAVVSMIDKIEDDDPASALVWAQSLTDPDKRQTGTQEVYQAWFKKKPLEAAAAIQSLPPDQQKIIFAE